MGPWHHGQEIDDGSTLGAHCDSAAIPRSISAARSCGPFLDHYLEDGAPAADVRPSPRLKPARTPGDACRVAGGLRQRLHAIRPSPLYLTAGLKLSFTARKPATRRSTNTSPIPPSRCPSARGPSADGLRRGNTWPQWLVDDQREASGRPDVLAFVSDVLTAPVKISGQPVANLVASTSGTDSDWVVKLIDVYPDEVAGEPAMGGYQLMISADIFRGRYRESLETPKPIAPASRCSTASPCPRRTTSSCRATGSWCRCSRVGSRSTTAIRRRSCPISSGPSRRITWPPHRRGPWKASAPRLAPRPYFPGCVLRPENVPSGYWRVPVDSWPGTVPAAETAFPNCRLD
jgi:hypothetical protein